MNDINRPEYLDDTDPEKNINFYRQDHGGMITNHNGMADKLLQNDDLYRAMKGDWKRTDYNRGKNIKVTTGRQDGKFYITREQTNTEAIIEHCKLYREAAEAGLPAGVPGGLGAAMTPPAPEGEAGAPAGAG